MNLDDSTERFSSNYAMLVPVVSDKDKRARKDHINRIGAYAFWLDDNDRKWWEPALEEYRDFLLNVRKLAPSTVNAHLATIRSRIRSLLEGGEIEKALYDLTGDNWSEETRVDEVKEKIDDIRHAIAIHSTRVELPESETDYIRLTDEDALRFLKTPKDNTADGVRARAIIALMYTTGLRENEVCTLQVTDLYCFLDGKPALHVPRGRGCTERLVPYGGLIWGLDYVNEWLLGFKIAEGPVFRGFYKGGNIRPTGLSVRALENILASFPIVVKKKEVKIRPMDLRRAYARLLYGLDMPLVAIRDNLGVNDINTVLDYIGPTAVDARIPPSIISF